MLQSGLGEAKRARAGACLTRLCFVSVPQVRTRRRNRGAPDPRTSRFRAAEAARGATHRAAGGPERRSPGPAAGGASPPCSAEGANVSGRARGKPSAPARGPREARAVPPADWGIPFGPASRSPGPSPRLTPSAPRRTLAGAWRARPMRGLRGAAAAGRSPCGVGQGPVLQGPRRGSQPRFQPNVAALTSQAPNFFPQRRCPHSYLAGSLQSTQRGAILDRCPVLGSGRSGFPVPGLGSPSAAGRRAGDLPRVRTGWGRRGAGSARLSAAAARLHRVGARRPLIAASPQAEFSARAPRVSIRAPPPSLPHALLNPRAPQTPSRSPQVMSCPLFWRAQPIGLAASILPEPAWALPRTSSRSPRSRP